MFDDRDRMELSDIHTTALDCLEAGVEAAHPDTVTDEAVAVASGELRIGSGDGAETVDLSAYDEVQVLGGGKAASAVAVRLEALLGAHLSGGVIVTDRDARGDDGNAGDDGNLDGSGEPVVEPDQISVRYGSHPVPDRAGVDGAREVLDRVSAADDRTLILGVITGGGSALLPAPAEGISLEALEETTDALLSAGATIHEINAVRKHLSALKGGRLAAAAAPARVVCLVLSDVVGNDLDVIASGPFVPDPSTYADAVAVLDRYDLAVPESVRERLERGTRGDAPETPEPGDPVFDRVSTHVLADGYTAADAAREQAEALGYNSLLLSSRVRGESREAARTFVAVGEEITTTDDPVEPPAVVVAGGETTVTVRGDGRGGPNQEFSVSAAGELAGGGESSPETPQAAQIVAAAVDTDGFDGPTEGAGGIVDGTAIDRRTAEAALAENDAYDVLSEHDRLLKTGKTGTNVNDIRVLVVDEPDGDGI